MFLLVSLKWVNEPSDITVNFGERIAMKCSASGSPKPKIFWHKIEDEKSEN